MLGSRPFSRPCSLLLGAFTALGAGSCKKSPPPSDGQSSKVTAPSASASAAPAISARCREATRGASFLVGEPGKTPRSEDGEEPALPFAVELGGAVAYGAGFAVTGFRGQGGGTEAILALVNLDASGGRILSLGRTHGIDQAPSVASRGERLAMVVPDGDAAGQRLRLAGIRDPQGRAEVVWGQELSVGRPVQSFAVELGEAGGLLVWDEEQKEHNVVRGAAFDAADLSKPMLTRTLSRPVDDAETPRLAARPGGYWLGFIAHRLPGAKAPPKSAPKPRPSADEDDPDELMELGPRWLEVMPLDGQGAPIAPPKAVSPEHSHVLVFDLAAEPGGAALLTWRDDRTTPGAEGGSVHLARVTVDGSLEKTVIDDDDPGAGVPLLVVDETSPAKDFRAWLALSSRTDATRVGRLGITGKLMEELAPDPVVRGADLLAARDGRLLIARPRGLAQELAAVRCDLGTLPGAGDRSEPLPPTGAGF